MFSANRFEHRYQLCATFKAKDASRYNSYNSDVDDGTYSSYLDVSGHGKGEVCYKLSETTSESADSSSTTNGVKLKGIVLN